MIMLPIVQALLRILPIVWKGIDKGIVDDHPNGYPQLAAWINCDDNFLTTRKYGFLRSRVLLYRQDELAVLERQLIKLDDEDRVDHPDRLQSRKLDEHEDKDPIYSRKALIQKIDDKLKEYGMRIPACAKLETRAMAENGDRRPCEQNQDLRFIQITIKQGHS